MTQRFLLGLTGPTGAGKSSIAALLVQHGFYLIDGDQVAREVAGPGSPLLPRLEEAFSGVLRPDGTLDRKALAAKAFSAKEQTRLLNEIMHPVILKEIEKKAKVAFASGYTNIVVDAAALFESGADAMCDKTAVVLAPGEERLARILRRDSLTREEALQRIRVQQPDDFYRARADLVLETRDNVPNGPLVEELLRRFGRL